MKPPVWAASAMRGKGPLVLVPVLALAGSGCSDDESRNWLDDSVPTGTSTDMDPEPAAPSDGPAEPSSSEPTSGAPGGQPGAGSEPEPSPEPRPAPEPEPAPGPEPAMGTEPDVVPEPGEAPGSGGAPADASAPAEGAHDGGVPLPADAAPVEPEPSSEPPLTGLLWPIDCVPEQTCISIGYPDIDEDGLAHDCGPPGYQGHQGTDISVSWEQMDEGIDVFAAADGEVLFVFDGKYDRCPNAAEPDCADPPGATPGNQDGVQVCTPLGPYCGTGEGSCFWCFWGGNVIVMRHEGLEDVFATRYDHLRMGSILVAPGDLVEAGQKIAEVGSAGNSTGPHLHFEVWTTGFYELGEPWVGECGPNTSESLWQSTPPWL